MCVALSVCFRREKPRQKNSSFNIRAGDGFVDVNCESSVLFFVDDFSHAI